MPISATELELRFQQLKQTIKASEQNLAIEQLQLLLDLNPTSEHLRANPAHFNILSLMLINNLTTLALKFISAFEHLPEYLFYENEYGKTPLWFAVKKRQTEVVFALRDKANNSSDPTHAQFWRVVSKKTGKRLLHLAAEHIGMAHSHPIFHTLVAAIKQQTSHDANILNYFDMLGNSALHSACLKHASFHIVELINAGASLTAINFKGETSFDLISKLPAREQFYIFNHLVDSKIKKKFYELYRVTLIANKAAVTSDNHKVADIYFTFSAQINLRTLIYAHLEFNPATILRAEYEKVAQVPLKTRDEAGNLLPLRNHQNQEVFAKDNAGNYVTERYSLPIPIYDLQAIPLYAKRLNAELTRFNPHQYEQLIEKLNESEQDPLERDKHTLTKLINNCNALVETVNILPETLLADKVKAFAYSTLTILSWGGLIGFCVFICMLLSNFKSYYAQKIQEYSSPTSNITVSELHSYKAHYDNYMQGFVIYLVISILLGIGSCIGGMYLIASILEKFLDREASYKLKEIQEFIQIVRVQLLTELKQLQNDDPAALPTNAQNLQDLENYATSLLAEHPKSQIIDLIGQLKTEMVKLQKNMAYSQKSFRLFKPAVAEETQVDACVITIESESEAEESDSDEGLLMRRIKPASGRG